MDTLLTAFNKTFQVNLSYIYFSKDIIFQDLSFQLQKLTEMWKGIL